GLTTIAVSVFMIQYNHQLHDFFRSRGLLRVFEGPEDEEEEADAGGDELRGHVIVVGQNALGRRIVNRLLVEGMDVVAVDTDPAKLEGLRCRTVLGNVDHLSVLEEAGFRNARLVVSALQIENTNALLAYRGSRAGIPTSIHAFDQAVVGELKESGATHLLQSKSAGIRRLITVLQDMGRLTT
ncbi:MAG TPA: NAD-binding protein, partial [Longimicrobiales bacterium]|nr:NAD-binding protein [Longimicrobiales bacterium]